MLLTVWRKLGLDDRKRCMIQLKGYIEQLRSLVPPEPGKVQFMTGKVSLTSDLVTMIPRGPFESHDAMHEFFHPQPPSQQVEIKRRYYGTPFLKPTMLFPLATLALDNLLTRCRAEPEARATLRLLDNYGYLASTTSSWDTASSTVTPMRAERNSIVLSMRFHGSATATTHAKQFKLSSSAAY